MECNGAGCVCVQVGVGWGGGGVHVPGGRSRWRAGTRRASSRGALRLRNVTGCRASLSKSGSFSSAIPRLFNVRISIFRQYIHREYICATIRFAGQYVLRDNTLCATIRFARQYVLRGNKSYATKRFVLKYILRDNTFGATIRFARQHILHENTFCATIHLA